MSRDMTPEERDSLRTAFFTCKNWTVDEGVYVGENNGWKMLISSVEEEPSGWVANMELDIQLDLTPKIVKAWAAHIKRTRPS